MPILNVVGIHIRQKHEKEKHQLCDVNFVNPKELWKVLCVLNIFLPTFSKCKCKWGAGLSAQNGNSIWPKFHSQVSVWALKANFASVSALWSKTQFHKLANI